MKWLGRKNTYENIQKYLFWRRLKVAMSQLSKEKQFSVAEKHFKGKSYIRFEASFPQRFNHPPNCRKIVQ